MGVSYESFSTSTSTGTTPERDTYRLTVQEERTPAAPDGHVPHVAVTAVPFELPKLAGFREDESTVALGEAEQYKRQLDYVRAERDALQARVRSQMVTQQALTGQAVASDIAMFILSKLAEAQTLHLDTLAAHLTAPHGWIAFARLWRAQLIDCHGGVVVPTDAGLGIVAAFFSNGSKPKRPGREGS